MIPYLHKYQVKEKPYYVIRYKNKYIAGSRKEEEIRQIYKECEEAEWDYDKVLQIKEKHRKHRSHDDEMKYISQNQYGLYIISKDKKFYISHKEKEEIIKLRDLLIANDWDMSSLPKTVIRRDRKNRKLPKYISKTQNGNYQIHHGTESYGTFRKLEDAIAERDLLIEYDWTDEYIDLY